MKKIFIILNAAALVIILKYWAFFKIWQLPEDFEFRALAVGQGDALLLTLPDSTVQILIDAGADEAVVPKLKDCLPPGDKTIEVVVLTHAHDDHVGGLPAVAAEFSIGLILDAQTKNSEENENYQQLMEQVELKKIPLLFAVRGEKIKIGSEFEMEVLHPFWSRGVEYKNLNNASVVLAVHFGARVNEEEEKNVFDKKSTQLLLTGDLEAEGEEEMISYLEKKQKKDLLKAELLKIGHHGSKTATTEKLLDLVQPQKAVISFGENNQFSHPHAETLEKLEKRGIEIMTTEKENVLIQFRLP